MMTRMLPVAVLTLSLGLCACEPEQCNFFALPPEQRPGLFLVNEQVSLPLQPLFQDVCEDGKSATPTGISAELYDPDQLPVEHQAMLEQGGLSATLEFVPHKPGRYHIFAAFEPVGGIHQFDAYAAVDRTAEASLQTLSKECTSLERTRSGALVCGLELYRNGVSMLQVTSGRLAVSGDVVWRVDTAEITRYVDTGTAITRTGSLAHTAGVPEAVLATETELVVLHATRIQRFVFDGQTLTRTGDSSWDAPPIRLRPDGPLGVMVRTGDRLAVISTVFASGSSRLQVCSFQLEQGRFLRTQQSCEQLPGVVVGFEPSVLWVGEENSSTFTVHAVHRLEWTGMQWLKRGSLDLGQVLRLPFSFNFNLRRSEVVPVFDSPPVNHNAPFRNAVPVYVPNQPQLRLDFLDANVTRAQASSSLFWGAPVLGTIGGGTSRIRLRPSPP
jgi:hypothetical protein